MGFMRTTFQPLSKMYKYVRLMHWVYELNPVFIPINILLLIIYLSLTGVFFLPFALYVVMSKPTPVFIDFIKWWFNPNYKQPK